MILSVKTIRALMASGQLGIAPMEPGQVQPASVDVRLGRSFSGLSAFPKRV